MAKALDRLMLKAAKLLENEKETFICSKISDRHYKISDYDVKHIQGAWQVTKSKGSNQEPIVFNERVTAVAYCALMHVGNRKSARGVLNLDVRAQQLQIDEQMFRVRLSSAINKKDDWKIDLYNARYSNVKLHLANVKTELQKTLTFAKYIKLWSDQ